MRPRLSLAAAALAALVAFGSTSSTSRADDTAAAQALFDEGKRLIAAGNYKEACPKLEESERLSPALGTRFNLADCYEHIGRTASAWAHFIGAASAAKAAGQPAREKAARDRAAALEPKLAHMAIVVPDAARVSGLEVKRDEETVGAAQWGQAVPVDPGQHAVVATAPGKRAYRAVLDVGEASTTKVLIPSLEDAPADAAPPAAKPPPVDNDANRGAGKTDDGAHTAGGTSPTLGWVLVGAGVVALGGGAAFWVLRGNEVTKLDGECGPDRRACPADASGDIANGKTY
jgi:hypothetical protein